MGLGPQPSIYPDIAGILENPQAAYEKLSKLGGGLVKLPSADGLGDALSSTGGIAGLVKGKAGGSIEDLIQADQGSRQQGVVQGLGRLLGADQAVLRRRLQPNLPRLQSKSPSRRRASRSRPRQRATASKPVGSPPAQPAAVAPAKPAPKERMQHTFGAF